MMPADGQLLGMRPTIDLALNESEEPVRPMVRQLLDMISLRNVRQDEFVM